MIGIAIDTVVLMVIVSFLANRNLSETSGRFALVALGTSFIGLRVLIDLPLWVAISTYLCLAFVGLRSVLNVSWPRSLISSVLFIGYKFVLLPAILPPGGF